MSISRRTLLRGLLPVLGLSLLPAALRGAALDGRQVLPSKGAWVNGVWDPNYVAWVHNPDARNGQRHWRVIRVVDGEGVWFAPCPDDRDYGNMEVLEPWVRIDEAGKQVSGLICRNGVYISTSTRAA